MILQNKKNKDKLEVYQYDENYYKYPLWVFITIIKYSVKKGDYIMRSTNRTSVFYFPIIMKKKFFETSFITRYVII